MILYLKMFYSQNEAHLFTSRCDIYSFLFYQEVKTIISWRKPKRAITSLRRPAPTDVEEGLLRYFDVAKDRAAKTSSGKKTWMVSFVSVLNEIY